MRVAMILYLKGLFFAREHYEHGGNNHTSFVKRTTLDSPHPIIRPGFLSYGLGISLMNESLNWGVSFMSSLVTFIQFMRFTYNCILFTGSLNLFTISTIQTLPHTRRLIHHTFVSEPGNFCVAWVI